MYSPFRGGVVIQMITGKETKHADRTAGLHSNADAAVALDLRDELERRRADLGGRRRGQGCQPLAPLGHVLQDVVRVGPDSQSTSV